MKRNIFLTILILLAYHNSSAQSRWIQQFLDEFDAPCSSLMLTYDHGYLLSGWISPNYPLYTWLIKTNVNGEVLWQKFIGDSENPTAVDELCFNAAGEMYLGGGIVIDGDGSPLLIKLNSCGEKEWCREFITTSNNDGFTSIVCAPDGGCAALIYGAFFPHSTHRSGILKFSSSGILLWQQYYESPDPGVQNEDLSNLILTPDNGFLMTGTCYYPDPDNPDMYWLHPYYIKVNSLGSFEWETVVHQETGEIGGEAMMSLVNPQYLVIIPASAIIIILIHFILLGREL